MFPRFEMWVGEAEEYCFELGAEEEVWEELHSVGAQDGDVGVGWWWGVGG